MMERSYVVLLLDKFARVRFFIRLRCQIKSMKIFRYCPERMTNKHIASLINPYDIDLKILKDNIYLMYSR